MRRALLQFVSITRLTVVEVIRQPIGLLLVTSCILFIGLLPVLVTHTLGEADRLIRDSALSLALVTGLLFGATSASSVFSRELHTGTAQVILSAPISRNLFFLAKFAGVILVLAFFEIAAAISAMISTYAARQAFEMDWAAAWPLLAAPGAAYLLAAVWNFARKGPFCSAAFNLQLLFVVLAFAYAANRPAAQGQEEVFPWNVAQGAVLIGLAAMTLTAISIALATRLRLAPTIGLCFLVLMLGLVSDHLLGRSGSPIAGALYALLPNWNHFWVMDALTVHGFLPWEYVFRTALYALIYTAAILGLGLLAFRRMDIKA